MTQQDLQILHELQRYAQRYFDAIYKGALIPGEYYAKQLIRDRRKEGKSAAGYYVLPENEEFKTDIEITVGSFSCSFPYHSIFEMLARWEAIFKPGKKDKATFAVGDVEVTTAPVIYQEKRNGKYIVKKVRLQRVLGNYWRPAKQSSDIAQIELIYELNGVYFVPGCKFSYCLLKGELDDLVKERLEGKNDAWITKQLLAFCEKNDYFKEIVELTGIAKTQAENETEEKELPQHESKQAESEQEETPVETLAQPQTVCVPVLQYASDGNTIVTKKTTLFRIREDAYYYNITDSFGITNTILVLRRNNVFWKVYRYNYNKASWNSLQHNIAEKWVQNVFHRAETGAYANNLEIKVCSEIGYDVTGLRAAHDNYLRKQEEKERQEYEKELQARKEKEQAEQARKVQLVDDARKKILSGGELTVEQIELLAESLDYHIHGRTLGMMRERITAMSINSALSVSLSGYDIKKRNVSAACDVLRELYKLVLSETLPTVEEMSAPKATEIAQISTETTETKELSTDKENSVKTAENSQIEQLPGKEEENNIGVIADIGVNPDIVADRIGVSERIEPGIGAELNSRHCQQVGIAPTDTGPTRAIYAGALSPPGATKLAPETILYQPYPNIEINTLNSV